MYYNKETRPNIVRAYIIYEKGGILVGKLLDLLGIERWEYLNNIPNIDDYIYQVSSKGRIRRDDNGEWKYLQGTHDRKRTLVCLGRSTYNLGNLVLYAFGRAESPRGKLEYKDGDYHNNSLQNITLKK